MPPKTIGLIAHTGKRGVADLIKAVAEEFARYSIAVLIEKDTAAIARKQSDLTIPELGAQTDLLVVLRRRRNDSSCGWSPRRSGEAYFRNQCWLVRLFDLCQFFGLSRSCRMQSRKDRINFSERTLLEVTVKTAGKKTGKMTALNDAVLSRGELSRLVLLRTMVDGEALTEFNADGLIVATPTGSTAYSLSAGGPILEPESGVLVITPICPHVLTNRSIIVAETSVIEIEVSDPDYPVFLTLDGREPLRVEQGSTVVVRKAKQTLPLAVLAGCRSLASCAKN